MTTRTDGNRKAAIPGQKAVGFRTPGQKRTVSDKIQKRKSKEVDTTNPAPTSVPETNARNAPPMQKRAKGRGFFGFLFLAVALSAGYALWTSFLQYQSYGVIEGRLISVSAPWNGTMVSWQVRDGELVEQGDVLANITNLAMQHELASLGDELKMSQAQLDAEMSRIRFDVQDFSERSQKAVAEHLQASGELMEAQARFKELDAKLERARRLLKSKNLSKSQFEELYYQHVGQKRKIEKLEEAVDVLKARSESANQSQKNGSPQLKPLLAKIERTQAQMARLRERIDQGQVKAPVSGRITKRHCLTGEAVSQGDPVLEILEDNSIEAVLYVPQSLTDEFEIGKDMQILLDPYQHPLTCTIKRIGDRYEPAPSSIARYYHSNQYVLPVYMTPRAEFNQLMAMRIHGTIKRPYQWQQVIEKGVVELKARISSAIQNAKKEKTEALDLNDDLQNLVDYVDPIEVNETANLVNESDPPLVIVAPILETGSAQIDEQTPALN